MSTVVASRLFVSRASGSDCIHAFDASLEATLRLEGQGNVVMRPRQVVPVVQGLENLQRRLGVVQRLRSIALVSPAQ